MISYLFGFSCLERTVIWLMVARIQRGKHGERTLWPKHRAGFLIFERKKEKKDTFGTTMGGEKKNIRNEFGEIKRGKSFTSSSIMQSK